MPFIAMHYLTPLLLALSLYGCASLPDYEDASEDEFIARNHVAADKLLQDGPYTIAKDKPVIVATLVNVDALENSSTLGRIATEQISSRITAHGYSVIEVRLRNHLLIKKQEGELMLSRELQAISKAHNAQAAIVGSYAVAEELIYINLKLVSLHDSRVINAYDYSLPRSYNLNGLIDKGHGKQHVFQDPFYVM